MRAVVAVALLAFLASCGGGAAPPAQATATSAAPAATAAAAAPAPTPSPPPTPAAPSFLSLAGAAKIAQYKVTYKVTGTTGGQSFSSEQTWYVKGARRRFDLVTAEGAVSTFVLETGSFTCLSQAGRPTCISVPTQQNALAQVDQDVKTAPDQFDAAPEGTRQIAGQTAYCYTLRAKTAAAGAGQTRVCFTASGVPLLMQSTAQGAEATLEATAFSATVADADFQLPAQPVRIGAP